MIFLYLTTYVNQMIVNIQMDEENKTFQQLFSPLKEILQEMFIRAQMIIFWLPDLWASPINDNFPLHLASLKMGQR